MQLQYLIDENIRGPLWHAIQVQSGMRMYPLHVVRVGDFDELPIGASDQTILIWSEQRGRILVSADRTTMIGHFEEHIRQGSRSPGLFLIRPDVRIPDVLRFLTAMAYVSEAVEWKDRWVYIP